LKRAFIGLIAWAFLAGCATDAKNIEKLNYATALGVDFVDGQYHGYVQFINLQSVAKATDGKQTSKKAWVGKGVAPSLEQALFDIYRTAQERVFWGHVTAIVISDEALKQGIDTIYDSISRYYEFRLTPWVYATRGPIREILSMGGFYEQSTLSTILQEPKEIHSQTSFVEPIKLHKLMSRINEPGYTVCIPSVAVNTEQWKAELKPEPKLAIDGAIFMKQDKVKSFMSLKELSGLRWIRPGTVRAGIPVPDKTNPEVEVVFDHPKAKYELVRENERLRYRLSMRAKGYIVNWDGVEFASFNELIEQTKKAIEREIRQVVRDGNNRKTDVLNLEHELFRNHFRLWKSERWNEEDFLSPDVLEAIDLHLEIVHSGLERSKIALK